MTTTLGFPAAYVPGLALAPVPRHPSMRKPMALRDHAPPTQSHDPAVAQRAGAVIAGFAAALVQLDHFARQLQGLGLMQHETKRLLNDFVGRADALLCKVQGRFDSADADSVNGLSELLGQATELLLQLTVPQIEASLKHMHNMAESNLTYIP